MELPDLDIFKRESKVLGLLVTKMILVFESGDSDCTNGEVGSYLQEV